MHQNGRLLFVLLDDLLCTAALPDAALECFCRRRQRGGGGGIDEAILVSWPQVMRSQGWTDKFVKALSEMNPPFVGVVGPHHSGGNTRILTYDFTSRKVLLQTELPSIVHSVFPRPRLNPVVDCSMWRSLVFITQGSFGRGGVTTG